MTKTFIEVSEDGKMVYVELLLPKDQKALPKLYDRGFEWGENDSGQPCLKRQYYKGVGTFLCNVIDGLHTGPLFMHKIATEGITDEEIAHEEVNHQAGIYCPHCKEWVNVVETHRFIGGEIIVKSLCEKCMRLISSKPLRKNFYDYEKVDRERRKRISN